MAPTSIDNGIVIPEEFICPITLEIMEHPLVSRHGCSFERAAIAAWLRQGHSQCPLTRTPLRASDMIHNNHLAARIAKWRAANGLSPSAANTKGSFVEKDANAQEKDAQEEEEEEEEEEQRLAHIYGTAALPFKEVVQAFSKKTWWRSYKLSL